MFEKLGILGRAGAIAISAGAAMLAGGCNNNFNFIDHVTFKPSADLTNVTVSLVFANTVQTNLSGSFEVGNYGFLFVNPFTATEPFEIGFQLQTAIFNDQNYVKFTPTQVLPNGLPIGLAYPVVQIQDATPISTKFDLYGYVDVLHTSWLGTAAMFSFINDQYFPNGLSISQVFMRDNAGNPGIIASVFGPTVDGSGHMTRAGGIALFANVRQLISHHAIGRGARPLSTYRPELLPIVTGPRAAEYDGQYYKLRALESNLVRAFREQR